MAFLSGPFAYTFGLIFVAELGDKTLLATLLLATRHRPWPVLFGSWAGFAAQTAIALAGGTLFARLPPALIHWLTVAVFAFFGLHLLLGKEDEEASEDRPGRGPFAVTFLTVFAAEWGDATQLGTMALVARFDAPVQVGLGALLGLWAGAAIAVYLGRKIGNRVQPRTLRRIGGVLFLGFAVATALQGG
jgi:Ca2+/H+ antiporter, TMEM165/GDT1 family